MDDHLNPRDVWDDVEARANAELRRYIEKHPRRHVAKLVLKPGYFARVAELNVGSDITGERAQVRAFIWSVEAARLGLYGYLACQTIGYLVK